MAKDKNLKDFENGQETDIAMQPEDEVASGTMSDNFNSKSLEKTDKVDTMSGESGTVANEEQPVPSADALINESEEINTEETLQSKRAEEKKSTFDDLENNSGNFLSINKNEDNEFKIESEKNKNLTTNQRNLGGNYVPLLKDDGHNCPPLQYRSRSSGAIYGAGYDADIMQDNSRSLRTKKVAKLDDGLDDVDFKKPKPLWLKITLIVLTSIFSICAIFGIYILYINAGYERIYDMKYLEVVDNRPSCLARMVTYDIVTYNLNYGAFSSDYTYYKSSGNDANGKVVKGSSSRAISKERVEVNTKGSAGLMSTGSNANVEFFMFQEIDVDSTRTYYVDERQILKDVFMNYAEIFAETGSSNYIFSPLTSPVGKFNSGMVTFSAFEVDYAMRYSLPSNENFSSKYSSTDNCVSVVKCSITGVGNGRQLCLINVDVSMYESEEVRLKDLERLYEIIKEETQTRENYVIVGGSFSYLLCGSDGVFENKMKTPDWCKDLPDCFSEERLNEIGCRIVKDSIAVELKIGTTRDASVNFKRGETFEGITDGFIVSSNVIVDKVEVLDNEYLYSSHNPVRLTFKLK